MKLSFVVPIYNMAPYLRKCVESLLAQDYEDYEIILVDDGSTDDSWQIIQEYVSMFNGLEGERIRGIHQENRGLSAARNAGIMEASGEYICFVDSDDYWQPNVLASLMSQIEREHLDVLRFDYQNVRLKSEGIRNMANEREYEVFEPNKYPHPVDIHSEVTDGTTYLDTRMGYACYACQFVIRREIITNILFTPNIHFEDIEWLPRMMLNAIRVNSTPTIVYNYFIRKGSITQTRGDMIKIRKNMEDRLEVIKSLKNMSIQHPLCEWLRRMYSALAIDVLTTVSRYFYSERRIYMQTLRATGVYPLSLTQQGRTYTLRGIIANMSPRLLVRLLHIRYIL